MPRRLLDRQYIGTRLDRVAVYGPRQQHAKQPRLVQGIEQIGRDALRLLDCVTRPPDHAREIASLGGRLLGGGKWRHVVHIPALLSASDNNGSNRPQR